MKKIKLITKVLFFIILISTLFACTQEDIPIVEMLVEESENTTPTIIDNELTDNEPIEEIVPDTSDVTQESVERSLTRLTPNTYVGIWMPSIPGDQSLESPKD